MTLVIVYSSYLIIIPLIVLWVDILAKKYEIFMKCKDDGFNREIPLEGDEFLNIYAAV